MKALKLPACTHSPAPKIADGCRRLVIIGANGAGKTRFADALCADAANKVLRLNAIEALYAASELDPEHNPIDALVNASNIPLAEKQRPQCRLERILTLLMNDELVSLID